MPDEHGLAELFPYLEHAELAQRRVPVRTTVDPQVHFRRRPLEVAAHNRKVYPVVVIWILNCSRNDLHCLLSSWAGPSRRLSRLLRRIRLGNVLKIDEPRTGIANRPRRFPLAKAVNDQPVLPRPLGQPRELAAGNWQQEHHSAPDQLRPANRHAIGMNG